MRKNRQGSTLLVSGTLLIAMGIIALVLRSLDSNDFDVSRCLDVCGLGLLTVTVFFGVPCALIGLVLLVMGFRRWRRQ